MIESFRGQRLDAHYLGYFDCFNRQLFYEAHDVLEDLWLPDRHGIEFTGITITVIIQILPENNLHLRLNCGCRKHSHQTCQNEFFFHDILSGFGEKQNRNRSSC